MIDKRYNIFETATELVSLDCSSITGEASSIYHSNSNSLHQSILNLKSVLPTFTAQFNLFKQEIIEMSYIIVNKLMSVIKVKTISISEFKNDLEQSQSLNKSMKQQVIQLQHMITQFMDSYKKQMLQKQKQFNQKQKQVDQLKNILKLNFNSPRNLCKNCSQNIKVNHHPNQPIENSKQLEQLDLKLKKFFHNAEKNQEILIQSNEFEESQLNTRKSLQIIQQQNSQVTSLTDYLHSQRYSQKEYTSQSICQIIKSSRSGQGRQDKEKQQFYTGKSSALNIRNTHSENPQNQRYLSDYDKSPHDHQSPVGKINFLQNLQNKNINQIFSSRPNYQNCQQKLKTQNQKERRSSQIILTQKNILQGFKIERKTQQRTALVNKTPQNQIIDSYKQANQEFSLKAQLQQISKSSSCSDINFLGDSQKVKVNIPNKFQSPKNMNFLKQYHTHTQKNERLRTESSPQSQKYDLNKENIQIEYRPKPNEMGRKIIARKKMIMTHAKASTSRMETKKPLKQQCTQLINQPKYEDFSKKNKNFIEIKFIDSPQKQPSKSSHLLKPTVHTVFSISPQFQTVPRRNACMEYSSVNSNISAINQSAVKSHHIYHSIDKYQSAETPKSIHKITITPSKLPDKGGDRKSMSKSKEKLKVMSKSVNQDQSMFSHQDKQSKQRFLAQMNSNFFSSCNSQSISKIKNRNLSVQIGNNTSDKLHMKQNLNEIRAALISFDIKKILTALREVYYDGKLINKMKEGFGKVVYDNGITYEGLLRNGKKEGDGKFTLNGVVVFEGNFSNDSIQGQGNLRFFRYFAHSSCPCPKILQNASYFGSISNNQFNGMGTVFLNDKEKIVAKFTRGEPVGQLTFYTQNNIEFGHWPIE